MSRALAAILPAAAALAAAPLLLAGTPEKEQVRFNAADQAAARAAVLRPSDLGSSGWSGGRRKPRVPSTTSCPGYTPKQSDLVLTGAAEADYRRGVVAFQSVAQVLKTKTMVARDWARTVASPRAVACIRTMLVKSLPAAERLVSFRKLAFPPVARYAAAFRAVIDVTTLGQHVRVLADIVVVGRSRTELTLSAAAPESAGPSLAKAEVRLARVLLGRVRA